MHVIMVKTQGKKTKGWPEAIEKSNIVYPHQTNFLFLCRNLASSGSESLLHLFSNYFFFGHTIKNEQKFAPPTSGSESILRLFSNMNCFALELQLKLTKILHPRLLGTFKFVFQYVIFL